MKRPTREKKGQFVMIAVLLIAIMIISIGAVMHRAVTYYKHEPWDEYSTLVSNVETHSRRIVELSLCNFTNAEANSRDSSVLLSNLARWQDDLTSIYPGYGIILDYSMPNGTFNLYGANAKYDLGLNCTWNKRSSFSAANASFSLDVSSIGLRGYKFDELAFLNLTIVGQYYSSQTLMINVTVVQEEKTPVIGLTEANFAVDGFSHDPLTVSAAWDQNYTLLYTIECKGVASSPSLFTVSAWDVRGIRVVAGYP